VIRGFCPLPIAWGVIVGTYSSSYVPRKLGLGGGGGVLILGVKRDWSKPDANQGNANLGNVDPEA